MKALVIQHDHVSPPGPVGEALEARGFRLSLHQVVHERDFQAPNRHAPFPSLDGFDLIVPMGAPWSAYDEDTIGSWVPAELDLLREADRRGIPVLGICFGGQLLALAHGGSVSRAPVPEIGWTTIETDIPELVAPGPWFQWHLDRWETPPDSAEIARNANASQAFVIRRNLAVQFHPELTLDSLKGWYLNGGADQALAAGGDPEAMVAATILEEPAARERADELVRAFLERMA
ncbi:MAG: gamma-glutamyl-gamma-aminobutyrate hydrolase family protein [Ornithinimicrobium sp.]